MIAGCAPSGCEGGARRLGRVVRLEEREGDREGSGDGRVGWGTGRVRGNCPVWKEKR